MKYASSIIPAALRTNNEAAVKPFSSLAIVIREISKLTREARPDKIKHKFESKPPPSLFPTFIANAGISRSDPR